MNRIVLDPNYPVASCFVGSRVLGGDEIAAAEKGIFILRRGDDSCSFENPMTLLTPKFDPYSAMKNSIKVDFKDMKGLLIKGIIGSIVILENFQHAPVTDVTVSFDNPGIRLFSCD